KVPLLPFAVMLSTVDVGPLGPVLPAAPHVVAVGQFQIVLTVAPRLTPPRNVVVLHVDVPDAAVIDTTGAKLPVSVPCRPEASTAASVMLTTLSPAAAAATAMPGEPCFRFLMKFVTAGEMVAVRVRTLSKATAPE